MSVTKVEVIERLDDYISALDHERTKYFERAFKSTVAHPLEIQMGRKYARVVTDSSVHTFVNLENGDILKAASWKAPAPNGVRGSIFAEDYGMSCVGPFGAIYVNGPNVGF